MEPIAMNCHAARSKNECTSVHSYRLSFSDVFQLALLSKRSFPFNMSGIGLKSVVCPEGMEEAVGNCTAHASVASILL